MASYLVQQTEEFAREVLKENDASHDYQHVDRVRNLALSLARNEGLVESTNTSRLDEEMVALCALLHDVDDWKYKKPGEEHESKAQAFLQRMHYDPWKAQLILTVISKMGFKETLGNSSGNGTEQVPDVEESQLLNVVKDADQLDAIGAVGIARCFTFGGAKMRKLHDPAVPPRTTLTKEQYMKDNGTTINHFYEKLLLLKDKMRTESGRQIAENRHEFMQQFLEQFHEEYEGRR